MLHPARAPRPAVVVYRREFLPLSETFVADHIRGLTRWEAVPAYDTLTPDSKRADELGAVAVTLPDRLRKWRSQFFGVSPPLAGLIASRGARLVHAHFLPDGARICRFTHRHKLPLIVTAHGYDATLTSRAHLSNPDGRFFKLMERSLVQAASRIVCVSDFIRGELLSRGYPARKLVTLRLGVDIDRFRTIQAIPFSQRDGVIFVGRLVEKKGVELLLRAWSRLPEPLRTTRLRIVGNGPLRSELESLAQRLGVPAEFLGAQSRTDVLDLVRHSRIFAFPSTRASNGDAEGMGIVAMEAQALGLPVIAFDEGPGPEVIAHERSGLLARRRDVASFAGHLERLLVDEDLAQRLGRQGLEVVRERFDLKQNTSSLEDLYDEVCADEEKTSGRRV